MAVPRATVVCVAVPAWSGPERVDDAWDEGLGPLMTALTERGGHAAVLIAGRLTDEWSRRRPDAVACLRQRLEAGQIELLATPLHRPVTSALPERDVEGQLAAHLTQLKRVLGVRPRGAWVPHRVWDPTLPRLLKRAGLDWTVLDAAWLEAVGAPVHAVLAVEREGRAIDVLPAGPDGLEVVWLDGPGSVERAIEAATAATVLPGTLCTSEEGRTVERVRAYLPSGGPGGLWERHLLADHSADVLHKRMLMVSRLVRRLERAIGEQRYAEDAPDPHAFQQARRYLYRAQAAEAYAPDAPGGTVHPAHRDRAWRDLLRAERLCRVALGLPGGDSRRIDLDCDGAPEARVWTRTWSLTFSPRRAGTLTELSHMGAALNVLAGAEPVAFHDTWDGVEAAASWSLVTLETGGDGSMRAVLCGDSAVGGVPVRMTKSVILPDKGPLEVRVDVDNRGLEGARGMLGTELVVTLGGPRLDPLEAEEVPLSVEVAGGRVPLDEVIELPEIEQVTLVGWRGRLELEPLPAGRLRVEPLAGGAARVRVSWPVELWGRERERRAVRVNVREEPSG